MNMQKSTKLLAAGLFITAGIAGAAVYKVSKDFQAEKAQKERVVQIAASYKERCPPDRKDNSCFYEPSGLEESARNHVAIKEYAAAGLIYAKIGKLDEAKKMIAECDNAADKQGSQAIKDELSVRAAAIELYYLNTRKQSASAPPSAAPSAAKPVQSGK